MQISEEDRKKYLNLTQNFILLLTYFWLMMNIWGLNHSYGELCRMHCEPGNYSAGFLGESCTCFPKALNFSAIENTTFNGTINWGGMVLTDERGRVDENLNHS
jgi:hypothetical protein